MESYVALNLWKIRNTVAYVDARKMTFMQVLYRDTNEVNRSRYLVVKTNANRSWLLPETPRKQIIDT